MSVVAATWPVVVGAWSIVVAGASSIGVSAMTDSCVDGCVKESCASGRDIFVATTARFACRLDRESATPSGNDVFLSQGCDRVE